MKKVWWSAVCAMLWLAVGRAESPPERAERMQWWREARFGMFIHWGPVSLQSTEISWSRANTNPKCPNKGKVPVAVYDNLYKDFNPTNFNAEAWAALAQSTGMKYVVLTAKHCDGFLLWHSQVDAYNIAATPFKRDVCAELSAAVRKQGLHVGWYFSPMDWRDPDFRTERNGAFIQRMQGEIRELLTNYGPVDLFWFDYDGREALYEQATTYPLVKKLQPKILLTNRLDLNPGNNNRQILSDFADYYTPEQAIGGYDDERPWETCMTLGRQWSWKPDDKIKTTAEVLAILAKCVGGDGNLLLNVGPMPDGRIEPRQVEVLKGVGAWMQQNSESIYGTRGGPYKPGSFGASTRKGNAVYLHLLKWSGDAITLPALPKNIVKSTLLAGGEVQVEQTAEAVRVSIAEKYRQAGDTVVKLELDGSALDIAPLATAAAAKSLAFGKKVTASNVYHKDAHFGADKACDGKEETRWATDSGTKSAWLEVDLGKPVALGGAAIEQAYPELKRCKKFQIEYWQDEQWKACYRGENLGETLEVTFAPVTAQRVRLNITEATDGPTISEFALFPPKK